MSLQAELKKFLLKLRNIGQIQQTGTVFACLPACLPYIINYSLIRGVFT